MNLRVEFFLSTAKNATWHFMNSNVVRKKEILTHRVYEKENETLNGTKYIIFSSHTDTKRQVQKHW